MKKGEAGAWENYEGGHGEPTDVVGGHPGFATSGSPIDRRTYISRGHAIFDFLKANPTSEGAAVKTRQVSLMAAQLAEKLAAAYNANPVAYDINETPPSWLDVADECIRQMEWARRETARDAKTLVQSCYDGEHRWVNAEDILHRFDLVLSDPLTLAPKGWTP